MENFFDQFDFEKVSAFLKDGGLASLGKVEGELEKLCVKGEAGAGLVVAEVNGRHQLTQLSIDDSLMGKDNREMLEDLVVGAVNVAMKNVQVKITELGVESLAARK